MKKALFLLVAVLAMMTVGCTNNVEKQVEKANEEAALNDNKAADPAVVFLLEDAFRLFHGQCCCRRGVCG